MGRFGSFCAGVAVGAIMLITVMNYHVVRTDRGTHLIPKTVSKLGGTYADIRAYGVSDWRQNPDLARAMVSANRRDLVADQSPNGFRRAVGSVLGTILGPRD